MPRLAIPLCAAQGDPGMAASQRELAIHRTRGFAVPTTQVHKLGFVSLSGLATLGVQTLLLMRAQASLQRDRKTMITLIITRAGEDQPCFDHRGRRCNRRGLSSPPALVASCLMGRPTATQAALLGNRGRGRTNLAQPFDILAKPTWLGREDSNLRWRNQNPLPYPLATPHPATRA